MVTVWDSCFLFSLLFCQIDILFFSSLLFSDIGQFCPSFSLLFESFWSSTVICIVLHRHHRISGVLLAFRLLNVVRVAIQIQWEAWVWGGETLLTELQNQNKLRWQNQCEILWLWTLYFELFDDNKCQYMILCTTIHLRYRLPHLTLGPKIGTPLQSTRRPILAMLVMLMRCCARCWADLSNQFGRRSFESEVPITKHIESS